jgi:hypothetical protein
MKRLLVGFAAVVMAVAGAGAGLMAGTAQAATASCATAWGSLPRQVAGSPSGSVTAVRAGHHACFDRLVLDFDALRVSYTVQYGQVLTQGQGIPLPLRGGAALDIVVRAAADHHLGTAVAGFQTFREVGFGGSFEGYTTVGLGVRARLPFRVLTVAGPGSHSRLVIDVAHRW